MTMPVRETPDRRGRAVRGRDGLLDREPLLRLMDAALDAAANATGRALLIEGHAGMGKTRLHEAVLDGARARGMHVLRAVGAELESEIAYGVAVTLFDAQLRLLSTEERGAALGPQGLFELLAMMMQSGAALIALDDLHWCDAASLEFVLYLLHRLERLPLAVVMTRRPTLAVASPAALDRIATHPRVRVCALSALSQGSVGVLARQALGALADEAVVAACREATSGNPFYLGELLMALQEEDALAHDALAERARALAPPAVIRSLRVRVGRVGAAGATLARAVAVLGDDVPLRHAAELAGLPVGDAVRAADALAAMEIFVGREPLRFVHPLVRQAIVGDVPASELASRHLDAARLLAREDTDPERIAAHLLHGRAQGQEWAVDRLRDAARDAMTRGAPQSAVRYLRRATEEPPREGTRVAVWAELGTAEAAAGLPGAVLHLERAAAGTRDPHRRAELALRRGHALYLQGHHREAAAAYDDGVRELGRRLAGTEVIELHDTLQTGFVAASALLPELYDRGVARSARSLARARGGPRTHGQRQLLAQAGLHSALAGEPATATLEFAEDAWDDGRLLERESPDGPAWSLVVCAVCWCGALERGHELLNEVDADARWRASPHGLATASFIRGTVGLVQGRVSEACADLELARDARRHGWGQFARSADAFHCLCLLEAGQRQRAGEVLVAAGPLDQPRDLEDGRRLLARAELGLAEGRPEEALADALAVGQLTSPSLRVIGPLSWRVVAAQAALALGRREQALELARQEFAVAERAGGPHVAIRAHRILGLCEQGSTGLGHLRTAAELGLTAPPRLETTRALVELGAALRRSNRRAEARDPLQRAIDLALEGGAHALHQRARIELAATGARPRRQRLMSGPESLTPSERRIAELAATGQSNREIGQALFVTSKTVEYHLRNVYRKLGIESRRELASALGGGDEP
jgi:DNA-binding CsgD family transcriptional regulator